MPFDILECTRHTMRMARRKVWWIWWIFIIVGSKWFKKSLLLFSYLGLKIVIFLYEQGMFCKYMSWTCVDYVTGPCTHRPSLPLIVWKNEEWGERGRLIFFFEFFWIFLNRRWRSRNKVSVDESADGSLRGRE